VGGDAADGRASRKGSRLRRGVGKCEARAVCIRVADKTMSTAGVPAAEGGGQIAEGDVVRRLCGLTRRFSVRL
jgi:hypothetical protein